MDYLLCDTTTSSRAASVNTYAELRVSIVNPEVDFAVTTMLGWSEVALITYPVDGKFPSVNVIAYVPVADFEPPMLN